MLGHLVKDAATGFTGIATNRVETFNGNIQIGIQPTVNSENILPDSILIDHHMVEVIGIGVSDRTTSPINPNTIALGSKVVDIISGFTGHTVSKSTHMNGCEQYYVVAQIDKKGHVKEDWYNSARLQTVAEVTITPPKPARSLETGVIPGGPSSKMLRQKVPRV